MPRRAPKDPIVHPVVWVTGASRGIGREIARTFATIGAHVCLSARDGASLRRLVREIAAYGGRAYAFPSDFGSRTSIERTARHIRRAVGPVDVLVNNAGITVFKSFLSTSEREFADIVTTNLLGPVYAIKSVLPSMVKRKSGWIINTLSTASRLTFEGSSAYTASKAGLHGLSKVLREELRKSRVRVVDVLPGPTSTAMWSAADRRRHGARMMSPASIGEIVLALYQFPPDAVPEEVFLRPMDGDLS